MSKSIVKITAVLVPAILATLALVVVGAGAFSQNASSSTTMAETQATPTPGDSEVQTELAAGRETDLSGTYTGTVSYSEHEMSGEGTLTISGNSYELTVGTMRHSGSFRAVTTRGYTGAAMELGPTESGQTPVYLSLRVCKRGDNLSLRSVPGESRQFSFIPARSARGGRESCCRCGRSDR